MFHKTLVLGTCDELVIWLLYQFHHIERLSLPTLTRVEVEIAVREQGEHIRTID